MNDNQTATTETLAPGIQRITAPNPGPMTGPGTNTYVVGHNPAIVVDPAIEDNNHFDAIEAAAGDVSAIWLTHRHPDHAGGAEAFARRVHAPIRAWPQNQPGRFDVELTIDQPLADGERAELDSTTLQAIYTPGHALDHLAFYVEPAQILLAGDLLMADSSVVILPPEGRMSDYLESLRQIRTLPLHAIAPAHGGLLTSPQIVIDRSIAHREKRESDVLRCLYADTTQTVETITNRLYAGLTGNLRRAAAAQVEAHLIRLAEHGHAIADAGEWRGMAESG